MLVPVDDDFDHVAVVLLYAQDDMCPGGSIEHGRNFPEMFGDVFFNGWRDREVASCKFYFHPEAPLLWACLERPANRQYLRLVERSEKDGKIQITGKGLRMTDVVHT